MHLIIIYLFFNYTKIICLEHFTVLLEYVYWIIGVCFTILVFLIQKFKFDLTGYLPFLCICMLNLLFLKWQNDFSRPDCIPSHSDIRFAHAWMGS